MRCVSGGRGDVRCVSGGRGDVRCVSGVGNVYIVHIDIRQVRVSQPDGQTDRQTDRQTDSQTHTHQRPPLFMETHCFLVVLFLTEGLWREVCSIMMAKDTM